MERTEPALAPEWLRNTGRLNGGGSVSHSDDQTASKLARNKSFVNSNGHDFGRSFSSGRTTSTYFRRSSSSNGSGHLRSYNSFGRNHHVRDREKDTYVSHAKDKSVLGDRYELRRSQSFVPGKDEDTWHKKIVTGASTASGNYNNGLLSKGRPIGGLYKATFEREFPSLGTEERAVISEVGRVPSPVLSSAIQSLPVGTSTSDRKWTSALAEVPISVGSNGTGATPSSSMSVTLGTTTSLNMAEALAQGPSRAQTPPQLTAGSQKLEELAIRQSRLIPVTPSIPKTLGVNDKQKNKVGQQKVDIPKASNTGNIKNGATHLAKDNLSPRVGKLVNSTPAPRSLSGPTATRGPLNKHVLTVLEKRPTSQAQSRNDFFNSVRKKSMASSSSIPDTSTVLPSSSDKLAETEGVRAPNTSEAGDDSSGVSLSGVRLPETRGDLTCNGAACDAQKHVSNGEKHASSNPIFSEEEETKFLRSLGWKENEHEDLLTEEEINAFLEKVEELIKSNSSLRTPQGASPRLLFPFNSHIAGIAGISSGLSSSVAKLGS